VNLNDYLLSLIRTYVPILIGAALTWAARNWGIVLPEGLSAQTAIAVTGLVVAVYYGIVRALEMRWPWFGKLLGASKPPAYAVTEKQG
jgi:hypothetical protein